MKKKRQDKSLQEMLTSEFLHYFSNKTTEIMYQENYFLFQAFLFSQKIYERVESMKNQTNRASMNQNLGQVISTIMEERKSFISPESFQEIVSCSSVKNFKDRKVSFFRMILRHLKKRVLKKNAQDEDQVIVSIQKKLNKNTISKKKILALLQAYGKQVIQYLKSNLCIKDIINVNKSKTNKAFYILHLRDIAIEAQIGKLEEYPFYSLCSFEESIEQMIITFYKKIFLLSQKDLNKRQKDKNFGKIKDKSQVQTKNSHQRTTSHRNESSEDQLGIDFSQSDSRIN